MKCQMSKIVSRLAAWALATALAGAAEAWAAGVPNLQSSYRNLFPDAYGASGLSIASIQGGAQTNLPANGETAPFSTPNLQLRMVSFSFGHPVETPVAMYALGDVIQPPEGARTDVAPRDFFPVAVGNNTNAYWQNASGSAIWLPSRQEVVAACGGNVEIAWEGLSDTMVYVVSSVPTNRPARIYWTESPYNAPVVYLEADKKSLFTTLHYNSYVPRPTYVVTTNLDVDGTTPIVTTNLQNGIWINVPTGADSIPELRAIGAEGILLMEYYKDGTYKESLGVQPIQVLEPSIEIIRADIGTRLLPNDRYYGTEDLLPQVKAGISGAHDKMLLIDGSSDTYPAKANHLYALRSTKGAPWDTEVYWMHADNRGVQWPFEVDWFELDWPAGAVRVVLDDDKTSLPILTPDGTQVTVLSSSTLAAPAEDATIATVDSSDGSVKISDVGYATLRYASGDDFWLDVVRSAVRTDPSSFDLTRIDWAIASEMVPYADDAYILDFDGSSTRVAASIDGTMPGRAFTLEAWVQRDILPTGVDTPLLCIGTNQSVLEFGFDKNNRLYAQVDDNRVLGEAATNYAPSPEAWTHVALSFDGSQFRFYRSLDENGSASPASPAGLHLGTQLIMGFSPKSQASFDGRMDEVRIWNRALTLDELKAYSTSSIPEAVQGLMESYPMDEGYGTALRDVVDGSYAAVEGRLRWLASYHLLDEERILDLLGYPGYIARGTAYNVNKYAYPTQWEEDPVSFIFAVNTNDFEVWWARTSRNLEGMPAEVRYPSLPLCYRSFWPSNDMPEIVLASGEGTGTNLLFSPSIYIQNDPAQPGYNPNEEHAILLNGKVYAHRCDINALANVSEPAVLVENEAKDSSAAGTWAARPTMKAFRVVATNEQWSFDRFETTAGAAILPPEPLRSQIGTRWTQCSSGPGWRDRKNAWWAKAAGDDGQPTTIKMMYTYTNRASFAYPALSCTAWPALGTEIPFNPDPAFVTRGGVAATKTNALTFTVRWPASTPSMKRAQTLTTAANGLPEIWNQSSIQILYEQTVANGASNSVVLYDPVVEKAADLSKSVIDSLVGLQLARKQATGPLYFFQELPPSLGERLFFDPNRGAEGQLVLAGELFTPLVGDPYLRPNWLTAQERDALRRTAAKLGAADRTAFEAAIDALPCNARTEVPQNGTFVNGALGADGSGAATGGYVTLAFNNSTNVLQTLPISLAVFRVDPDLFGAGYLDVVEPANALEEKLSLIYPDDFGARIDQYLFDWRWADPSSGNEPTAPKEDWATFFPGGTLTNLPILTIEAGADCDATFMLADHYFAVRYRPVDDATNWSPWVSSLAPGWIQRVMVAYNLYEQKFRDMTEYAPDLSLSVIEKIGAPYQGPVALSSEGVDDAGILQIYQTVLERALSLSLDAGSANPSLNEALLYAATRLCSLYVILGNDAYADAVDPTIAIDPGTTDWYDNYYDVETSLFSFANQCATPLEEELALLRGRDDSYSPSVQLAPTYNRLLWNYTHGVDNGEIAYASTYHVKADPDGDTGVITAADAKRMYPQGHGDAWGHYLSALSGYYRLLAYTNFTWDTVPGATTVEGTTASVDYFDEQKFAAAALAKARTGERIVKLTARHDYVPRRSYGRSAADAFAPFVDDALTNRAWDVSGWASRVGQGTYFDWLTANSLLLDTLTNFAQIGDESSFLDQGGIVSGLNKIDRPTVPDLDSIAVYAKSVQADIDSVDSVLNPLGLDEGAIPFDLSASDFDDGKTHFEQVYDRAVAAIQNAAAAYDNAKTANALLRMQYDSAYEAKVLAVNEEKSYLSELIDIYGYPYSDDIGSGGAYAQGYDGPDLVHYMYLDLQAFGSLPTGDATLVVTNYSLKIDADEAKDSFGVDLNASLQTNGTLSIGFNRLGLAVKPANWKGTRRAQGRIQADLQEFVQAYFALISSYDHLIGVRDACVVKYDVFKVQLAAYTNAVKLQDKIQDKKKAIETLQQALGFFVDSTDLAAELIHELSDDFGSGLPAIMASIFPSVRTEIAEAAAKGAGTTAWGITKGANAVLEYAQKARISTWQKDIVEWECNLATNEAYVSIYSSARDVLGAMWDQQEALDDLNENLVAMQAACEKVRTTIAEGERIAKGRARTRHQIATLLQEDLYADMLYRTYRTSALARYTSLFEIAARYAFLAARAYDYETGLLNADGSSAAADFMASIVRARTIGTLDEDGEPMLGESRDGASGLAAALAALNVDWKAAKTRFGINNPASEDTRFSLRKELFRISSKTASDETWKNQLALCRVDNLNDVPEYVRYCVPYSTNEVEPGIVISFSTEITPENNFFGKLRAGGDSVFDPTWMATKIRAVGVTFSEYNAIFNTNNASGGGLLMTPHVYLVPAGIDYVDCGTDRSRSQTRAWTVFDQALPLPFDLGAADHSATDWSSIEGSFGATYATLRRHPSFRAYQDVETASEELFCTNARLIGRSAWNSRWLLIIPGRGLLSDPDEGLDRFIYGAKKADGTRDGSGIKDIRLFLKTYSYSGD